MSEKLENLKGVIEDRINSYKEEQFELLKTIVSIDTGSTDEEGIEQIAGIMGNELKKLGAEVEYIYEKGYGKNIVARIKPQKCTGKMLIMGHMDTVFSKGDTKEYPFRVDGDYAYGLGVSDMKGGLVTAYYAVKAMKDIGELPDKEIVFIFNCDEEIGTLASKKIIEKEAKNAEYAFAFEPSRGNSGIITSRRGCGDYMIEVWGEEAHSGKLPKAGKNANVEMADKVLKLYNIEKNRDDVSINVGIMQGGSKSNIVPGYAKAAVCARVWDIKTMNEIDKEIRNLENQILIDGCKVKVSGGFENLPFARNENNVKLYEIAKMAGKYIGLDLDEMGVGGSSDANIPSPLGVATIDGLGPYLYDIHTKNEHMYIPSLIERTKLFAMILACIKYSK